jgi:MFS family permease
VRWTWARAVLHRGWWLVTSVYLVVDAHLSGSQLVVIGAAQAFAGLACEVPAGVFADTVGRRWSLVISHALMGTAMVATGLVSDFGALVTTQMLWGVSWTFASGADVAWITDELGGAARAAPVLVRAGRAQLTGSATGILALGALGTAFPRSIVMELAGAAMLALGVFVRARFPERRFVAPVERRLDASWAILTRGTALVRSSRPILLLFAATLAVNGAALFGRLQPWRLVDLGLPTDPVLWFTAVGVTALLVGALALHVAGRYFGDAAGALHGYVAACVAGVVGAVSLGAAHEELTGSVAVILVAGIAVPLTRVLATIWLNERTTGDVRATVHSLLAQAEYIGVIAGGVVVAVLARASGVSLALVACGVLFAAAAALVWPVGGRVTSPRRWARRAA